MKAPILFFAPVAMAQSLCGQFDYYSSNGYYVNNNAWGADQGQGDQCTQIDNISSNGVTFHTDWNWSGGENNVKSYPHVGHALEGDKKLVKDITGFPNKAEWNYDGDNIRANVAYDIFTAQDPNHETSSGDYEIMIWYVPFIICEWELHINQGYRLANVGGVYPIGESTGNVDIGGKEWELFVGFNGDMKVFSFVAPQETKTFEEDLRPFFDHITSTQGFPAAEQHLISTLLILSWAASMANNYAALQFGSEPFTGTNARFDVYYWYANVN